MSNVLKVVGGQLVSVPVDSLQGVAVSATPPSAGQVLKATGPTSAEWGTGGGGGVDESIFLDLTIAGPAYASLGGGDYTSGNGFYVTRDATCTGMRFYWPGSSSITLRCSLYGAPSGALAYVDQVVSAAGIYAVTWGTPQALVPGTQYFISTYHNSTELRIFATVPYFPVTPYVGARSLVWTVLGAYASGDAKPVTQNNSDKIPAIPVFTVP